MIQFKVTFADPGTGAPTTSPVCQSGSDSLSIVADDGLPKYRIGVNLHVIKHIEVYVSGASATAHDFFVVAEDANTDHYIQSASHASDPGSDTGGLAWSRENGALKLAFRSPAALGTEQAWATDVTTPGLVLKVKVTRQEPANDTTECDEWTAITPLLPDLD